MTDYQSSREWLEHIKRTLAPYEVFPPKPYLTHKKKKLYPSACADKSFEYFEDHLDLPQVRIVGGLYHEKFGHLWIEIEDRIVFDGTLQRFYSLEDYYRLQKAEKIISYSTSHFTSKVVNPDLQSLKLLALIAFAGQVASKEEIKERIKKEMGVTGKLDW